MAKFAQIDNNNKVIQIIRLNNDVITDSNGIEQEDLGINFCKQHYGENTRWVQTWFDGGKRKNYAMVGGYYREDLDAFIEISPFPSWILNEITVKWQAPVPKPEPLPGDTSGVYITSLSMIELAWNENLQCWDYNNL
jgi:hypothetical protein